MKIILRRRVEPVSASTETELVKQITNLEAEKVKLLTPVVDNKLLIKILKPFMGGKRNLQVLYNFLIKDKFLYATDLKTTVKISVDQADGVYSWSTFSKTGSLNAAKTDEFTMDDFPCVAEQFEKKVEDSFSFDPRAVERAVEAKDFASDDFGRRISLTSVLIRDGLIFATDGYRLKKITLETGVKRDVLFPAVGLKAVQALLKISKLEDAEFLKEFIKLKFNFGEVIFKPVEGPYPDFEKALLGLKECKKYLVDSDVLRKAVEKITPLAGKAALLIFADGFIFCQNDGQKIFKTPLSMEFPEMAFNGKYLLQILGHLSGSVDMYFLNPLHGVTFLQEDSLLYIMPLRIKKMSWQPSKEARLI